MDTNWEEHRKKIIGLGETSIKKSYYPELQTKIDALEANQNNLSAIINSISDGIVIHSDKGDVLSFNNHALNLFGIIEGDLTTYNLLDFCVECNDKTEFKQYWADALRGKTKVYEWTIIQQKTKNELVLQVSASPIIWNHNKAVVAVLRDFTLRKKYEEELIQAREIATRNENLLSNIINSLPFDLFVKNKDGKIILQNNVSYSYWGDLNTLDKRIVKKNISENWREKKEQVYSKKTVDFEASITTKDGKTIPTRRIVSPLHVEDYKLDGAIFLNIDITEQQTLRKELEHHLENLELLVKERTEEVLQLNKELTLSNKELLSLNERLRVKKSELEHLVEELKTTQKQLIQSEKMASIGLLTSGIAHEINNPINFISTGVIGLEVGIEGILSALKEFEEYTNSITNNPEIIENFKRINAKHNFEKNINNISKLINAIQNGVTRTVTIVKGLRTFSRMDDESKSINNINDLIDSALTILFSKYRDSITIQKNYCENASINCFPGKLGQLFLNLITNSIQSITSKGTITISTLIETDRNRLKIIIEDTGLGIPEKIQKKIFDPFFTTKPVGQGTGLGLSIVHGIVNDHNGEIFVDSKEGEGTTFIVYLPI